MELLDVYDSNGKTTGRTIIRGDKTAILNENEHIALSVISFHGFAGPSISLDLVNDLGICQMSNSVHPIRSNKDIMNIHRPIITELIYDDYTGYNIQKSLVKTTDHSNGKKSLSR